MKTLNLSDHFAKKTKQIADGLEGTRTLNGDGPFYIHVKLN
jgi:hypothetical protein